MAQYTPPLMRSPQQLQLLRHMNPFQQQAANMQQQLMQQAQQQQEFNQSGAAGFNQSQYEQHMMKHLNQQKMQQNHQQQNVKRAMNTTVPKPEVKFRYFYNFLDLIVSYLLSTKHVPSYLIFLRYNVIVSKVLSTKYVSQLFYDF